jgi:hypothetical protein
VADLATLSIAGETRNLCDVEESWIIQQVNRRLYNGATACVILRLHTTGIDVSSPTPGCGAGNGDGRTPNRREHEVIDLWKSHRLQTTKLAGGRVNAFLKALRRYV